MSGHGRRGSGQRGTAKRISNSGAAGPSAHVRVPHPRGPVRGVVRPSKQGSGSPRPGVVVRHRTCPRRTGQHGLPRPERGSTTSAARRGLAIALVAALAIDLSVLHVPSDPGPGDPVGCCAGGDRRGSCYQPGTCRNRGGWSGRGRGFGVPARTATAHTSPCGQSWPACSSARSPSH